MPFLCIFLRSNASPAERRTALKGTSSAGLEWCSERRQHCPRLCPIPHRHRPKTRRVVLDMNQESMTKMMKASPGPCLPERCDHLRSMSGYSPHPLLHLGCTRPWRMLLKQSSVSVLFYPPPQPTKSTTWASLSAGWPTNTATCPGIFDALPCSYTGANGPNNPNIQSHGYQLVFLPPQLVRYLSCFSHLILAMEEVGPFSHTHNANPPLLLVSHWSLSKGGTSSRALYFFLTVIVCLPIPHLPGQLQRGSRYNK